ncbi:hypothetical protein FRC10_009874 [Ceratobasidium sp. 414]|nr:hypothetical protein FRC10_009874 [Ceratobasidium sp. 414]
MTGFAVARPLEMASVRRAMPAPVDAETAKAYLKKLVVEATSNEPAYGAETRWDERRDQLGLFSYLRNVVLVHLKDNVNQAKGDKDPAVWMPPLQSYHCTYVRAWIEVKHFYDHGGRPCYIISSKRYSALPILRLMSTDHRPPPNDLADGFPKRKGLPPVAKFVCGAALVLSAGLAVPFLLAKRRAALPPTAVHLSSTSGPAALVARATSSSPASVLPAGRPPLRLLRDRDTKRADEGGKVDTFGAINHALKAFGVATMLVGVGTGTVFTGITLGLGITTLGEFQTLMRSLVRSSFPQLHAQLHSVSDPATSQYYRTEIWEQERVERALEDALEKGGWRGWLDEARRQLERERAVGQRMAEIEGARRS